MPTYDSYAHDSHMLLLFEVMTVTIVTTPHNSARKHFSLTHSSQSADVDEGAIPITRTIHTLERVAGMSLYV